VSSMDKRLRRVDDRNEATEMPGDEWKSVWEDITLTLLPRHSIMCVCAKTEAAERLILGLHKQHFLCPPKNTQP
jgi:hypothetical protein